MATSAKHISARLFLLHPLRMPASESPSILLAEDKIQQNEPIPPPPAYPPGTHPRLLRK